MHARARRRSSASTNGIREVSAVGSRALAPAVVFLLSVSPDGAWLVARVEAAAGADSSQETVAFPAKSGGPPLHLCGTACEVDWTPSGSSLVVRLGNAGSASHGRTYVIALRAGEMLPRLPPGGIRSEADLAGLPLLQVSQGFVYPADVAPLVAFVRSTTQRNIYRIPLP